MVEKKIMMFVEILWIYLNIIKWKLNGKKNQSTISYEKAKRKEKQSLRYCVYIYIGH